MFKSEGSENLVTIIGNWPVEEIKLKLDSTLWKVDLMLTIDRVDSVDCVNWHGQGEASRHEPGDPNGSEEAVWSGPVRRAGTN